MIAHWSLALLVAACLRPGSGNPIQDQKDIQTQENFDLPKIYGKWYDVAIGSTCKWLKEYKDKFVMGTLVMDMGATSDELSTASTRIRQGVCSKVIGTYQKTNIPGKFIYYSPKWELTIDSYVVYTNYDEYAIVLMRKTKSGETTTTLKLYGRTPELRDSLISEFTQFALEQGVPRDSIFIMKNQGECIPGEKEVPVRRYQRAAEIEEEGSGAETPTKFNNNGDSCRQPRDVGPCLGMSSRFFYNSSSMTCESFHYGGCLGNGNNFHSERECLQTCRTEAACRLPVVSGPCRKLTPLYAFDAVLGKCIPFNYGGCQGNCNRFYTEKECKEYCGVPGQEEELLGLSF
ncbi:protein AMBP [Ambystoma mexicanum]|uniref:protein AMBP n=1 Tax=Ambystoma mexicanum TaxID=8296 RepID=UPI0037E8B9C4